MVRVLVHYRIFSKELSLSLIEEHLLFFALKTFHQFIHLIFINVFNCSTVLRIKVFITVSWSFVQTIDQF